jgi:hypothetical protein
LLEGSLYSAAPLTIGEVNEEDDSLGGGVSYLKPESDNQLTNLNDTLPLEKSTLGNLVNINITKFEHVKVEGPPIFFGDPKSLSMNSSDTFDRGDDQSGYLFEDNKSMSSIESIRLNDRLQTNVLMSAKSDQRVLRNSDDNSVESGGGIRVTGTGIYKNSIMMKNLTNAPASQRESVVGPSYQALIPANKSLSNGSSRAIFSNLSSDDSGIVTVPTENL